MAIDTSNTVSSAASAASPSAPPAVASTEDRFLKMLVAQLKNQDPLNPLDNAQVTSQMAQLSTVTGIDKLNSSITAMMASIAALQPIQAAGLVGKDVAVAGTSFTVTKGVGAGAYSLEQAVDTMSIDIKDGAGNTVRTLDLGAQKPGIAKFDWDGKDANGKVVADGDYTFSITASAAGKAVTPTTLAVANVKGVIPASDGFALNLGSRGVVPFARVAQIL